MPRASRVTLPKIQKVVLNRFSLYTLQPNIEINIPDGVFCLAGANGLGKSTFLASVNYGITGIVRDPARKFESIDEYYKYVQEYGSDYFEGRISETDRDAASIRICLQVGNLVYDLSRGFFETEELRELKITLAQSGEVVYDGTSSTSTERHRIYQEKITQDIGLGSFQQFVFLQLFVFTFDESRHLLLC